MFYQLLNSLLVLKRRAFFGPKERLNVISRCARCIHGIQPCEFVDVVRRFAGGPPDAIKLRNSGLNRSSAISLTLSLLLSWRTRPLLHDTLIIYVATVKFSAITQLDKPKHQPLMST